MPGESPSQPGWYPDRDGTMRWYDGASWTDHVQPGPGGAGTGPTQVQPSTPEPTQPLAQQPVWPPAGPPSGPPSGPPPQGPPGGSPYGAVPQPSFPGGPGGPGGYQQPPSSGGGNKGLLILLAVVGAIVLIAILAVGSWAIFVRDSDDSDSGNDGGDSSLPDTGPKEVVEAFFEAAETGDCEAALALVSEKFIAEEDANCDDEEDFMDTGDFEYVIGEATIDEDAETAEVPVTVTSEDFGDEELPLGLVVENGGWKIDSFGDVEPTESAPTDVPTDLSTDLPTDLPTDLTDLTDFTDFPTDLSDFPTEFPTDFPTDPSELESYLETYLSDFFTYTE